MPTSTDIRVLHRRRAPTEPGEHLHAGGRGVELELGGDASPEQLACAIGDHRRQLHWHSVTIPVAGLPGTTRRRLRREA